MSGCLYPQIGVRFVRSIHKCVQRCFNQESNVFVWQVLCMLSCDTFAVHAASNMRASVAQSRKAAARLADHPKLLAVRLTIRTSPPIWPTTSHFEKACTPPTPQVGQTVLLKVSWSLHRGLSWSDFWASPWTLLPMSASESSRLLLLRSRSR